MAEDALVVDMVKEKTPDIPELFLRLQSQAKEKGLTKDKILKDIRRVRRQLYREAFGDE